MILRYNASSINGGRAQTNPQDYSSTAHHSNSDTARNQMGGGNHPNTQHSPNNLFANIVDDAAWLLHHGQEELSPYTNSLFRSAHRFVDQHLSNASVKQASHQFLTTIQQEVLTANFVQETGLALLTCTFGGSVAGFLGARNPLLRGLIVHLASSRLHQGLESLYYGENRMHLLEMNKDVRGTMNMGAAEYMGHFAQPALARVLGGSSLMGRATSYFAARVLGGLTMSIGAATEIAGARVLDRALGTHYFVDNQNNDIGHHFTVQALTKSFFSDLGMNVGGHIIGPALRRNVEAHPLREQLNEFSSHFRELLADDRGSIDLSALFGIDRQEVAHLIVENHLNGTSDANKIRGALFDPKIENSATNPDIVEEFRDEYLKAPKRRFYFSEDGGYINGVEILRANGSVKTSYGVCKETTPSESSRTHLESLFGLKPQRVGEMIIERILDGRSNLVKMRGALFSETVENSLFHSDIREEFVEHYNNTRYTTAFHFDSEGYLAAIDLNRKSNGSLFTRYGQLEERVEAANSHEEVHTPQLPAAEVAAAIPETVAAGVNDSELLAPTEVVAAQIEAAPVADEAVIPEIVGAGEPEAAASELAPPSTPQPPPRRPSPLPPSGPGMLIGVNPFAQNPMGQAAAAHAMKRSLGEGAARNPYDLQTEGNINPVLRYNDPNSVVAGALVARPRVDDTHFDRPPEAREAAKTAEGLPFDVTPEGDAVAPRNAQRFAGVSIQRALELIRQKRETRIAPQTETPLQASEAKASEAEASAAQATHELEAIIRNELTTDRPEWLEALPHEQRLPERNEILRRISELNSDVEPRVKNKLLNNYRSKSLLSCQAEAILEALESLSESSSELNIGQIDQALSAMLLPSDLQGVRNCAFNSNDRTLPQTMQHIRRLIVELYVPNLQNSIYREQFYRNVHSILAHFRGSHFDAKATRVLALYVHELKQRGLSQSNLLLEVVLASLREDSHSIEERLHLEEQANRAARSDETIARLEEASSQAQTEAPAALPLSELFASINALHPSLLPYVQDHTFRSRDNLPTRQQLEAAQRILENNRSRVEAKELEAYHSTLEEIKNLITGPSHERIFQFIKELYRGQLTAPDIHALSELSPSALRGLYILTQSEMTFDRQHLLLLIREPYFKGPRSSKDARARNTQILELVSELHDRGARRLGDYFAATRIDQKLLSRPETDQLRIESCISELETAHQYQSSLLRQILFAEILDVDFNSTQALEPAAQLALNGLVVDAHERADFVSRRRLNPDMVVEFEKQDGTTERFAIEVKEYRNPHIDESIAHSTLQQAYRYALACHSRQTSGRLRHIEYDFNGNLPNYWHADSKTTRSLDRDIISLFNQLKAPVVIRQRGRIVAVSKAYEALTNNEMIKELTSSSEIICRAITPPIPLLEKAKPTTLPPAFPEHLRAEVSPAPASEVSTVDNPSEGMDRGFIEVPLTPDEARRLAEGFIDNAIERLNNPAATSRVDQLNIGHDGEGNIGIKFETIAAEEALALGQRILKETAAREVAEIENEGDTKNSNKRDFSAIGNLLITAQKEGIDSRGNRLEASDIIDLTKVKNISEFKSQMKINLRIIHATAILNYFRTLGIPEVNQLLSQIHISSETTSNRNIELFIQCAEIILGRDSQTTSDSSKAEDAELRRQNGTERAALRRWVENRNDVESCLEELKEMLREDNEDSNFQSFRKCMSEGDIKSKSAAQNFYNLDLEEFITSERLPIRKVNGHLRMLKAEITDPALLNRIEQVLTLTGRIIEMYDGILNGLAG